MLQLVPSMYKSRAHFVFWHAARGTTFTMVLGSMGIARAVGAHSGIIKNLAVRL
jgi:hypothetical protein